MPNVLSIQYKFITYYLILFLAFSVEGFAMSILNRPPEEVVLASPMEGYITLHNK